MAEDATATADDEVLEKGEGKKKSAKVDANGLTPAQKAAILVMSMGAEAAGQIFRHLSEEEVEELTAAITNTSSVDEEVRLAVLSEYLSHLKARELGTVGGMSAARSILNKALGSDKAARILEQVEKPETRGAYFYYLEEVETSQIVNVLKNEQPQTIAMIMAHLKPQRAAQILSNLPEEMMIEVAERIGTMDRVSPDVVKRIDATLKKSFTQDTSSRPKNIGGAKTIAEILNFTNKEASKQVFENLQDKNPPLVDSIKKLMVVFEDLAVLPDQAVQAILREVDMSVMALSLKGASEAMKGLVYRNLSQRAMERLKEELDLMGRKPRSEISSAQEQVVAIARQLEEDGKISLGKGGGGEDELID